MLIEDVFDVPVTIGFGVAKDAALGSMITRGPVPGAQFGYWPVVPVGHTVLTELFIGNVIIVDVPPQEFCAVTFIVYVPNCVGEPVSTQLCNLNEVLSSSIFWSSNLIPGGKPVAVTVVLLKPSMVPISGKLHGVLSAAPVNVNGYNTGTGHVDVALAVVAA